MLLQHITEALRSGDPVVVATVIGTSGSTPVPAGAAMMINLHGGIPHGTVGGGCVEADVIGAATALAAGGTPSAILRFALSEDSIESGMLCGGDVEILVEKLPPDALPLFEYLARRQGAGEDSVLMTLLDPARSVVSRKAVPMPSARETPAFDRALADAVQREAVVRVPIDDGEAVLQPVMGLRDLVIFGGGHVSKFVSRSAAMAGFRVTIVDDRPEYANVERFPEAWRTLARPFDRSWEEIEIRPSSFIVIVTRGHKFDERILARAVRTPARYVGMIGSRKKVETTYRRLIDDGTPAELLRNVRAPIGLSIGAVTAEEIGISITAELIAVRRGAVRGNGPMADRPVRADGATSERRT